jgi:hypothetical protein
MSKPTYVASQLKATVLGLLLCVIIFPVACNSKGPTSETPVAGGAAPAVQSTTSAAGATESQDMPDGIPSRAGILELTLRNPFNRPHKGVAARKPVTIVRWKRIRSP